MSDFGGLGGGFDPQTLAIIQYLLSQGGITQAGGAWTPQMADQLTFGYDPTQYEADMLGFMPAMTEEEAEEPLDYMKSAANFLQDRADLMADPVNWLSAGAGSYGNDVFAPEVSMELIPQPETLKFQNYATQGETSFEGWIASRVMQGATPRQAVSEMREIVDAAAAEGATEEQKQDAAMITRWLPTNNFQGVPEIDWTAAFNDATSLATPYLDEQALQVGPVGPTYDPQTGQMLSSGGEIVQGPDGQLYRQTTTPSPLAEKMRELGFTPPDQGYTAADFLGPQWAQAEQEYLAALPAMEEEQAAIDRDLAQASTNYGLGLASFAGLGTMPQAGQTASAAAKPAEQPSTNFLGTSGVPLGQAPNVGAIDVGDTIDPSQFMAAAGMRPTSGQIPPLMEEGWAAMDSPEHFEEWYNTNAANLTDWQRAQLISTVNTYATSGHAPAVRTRWARLGNQLSSDIANTQAPSTEPGLEDQTPEVVEFQNAAYEITDPAEFRAYMEDNLGQFDEGQLAELGGYALTQRTGDPDADRLWAQVGRDLMNGNVTPTGGGTQPKRPAGAGPGKLGEYNAAFPNAEQQLMPLNQILGGVGQGEPPGGVSPEEAAAIAAYWATPSWQRDYTMVPGTPEWDAQWGRGPAPSAPAPAPAPGPTAQRQPTLASPGNIGQTASMLRYLMNGQGLDYLYTQQPGMAAVPLPAPAAPNPEVAYPIFGAGGGMGATTYGGYPATSIRGDQARAGQAAQAAGPGMAAMTQYLLQAGVPQSDAERDAAEANAAATQAAEYWSQPSWQRDYTQIPGISAEPGAPVTPPWVNPVNPPYASWSMGAGNWNIPESARARGLQQAVTERSGRGRETAAEMAGPTRGRGQAPATPPRERRDWEDYWNETLLARSGRGRETAMEMAAPNRPSGRGRETAMEMAAPGGLRFGGRGRETAAEMVGPSRPLSFGRTEEVDYSGAPGAIGEAVSSVQRSRRQRLIAQRDAAKRKRNELERSVYGLDYSRARAMQDFLSDRGITPFSVQWATRSGALQRTGI